MNNTPARICNMPVPATAELKRNIKTNTVKAFVFTVIPVSLLVGIGFLYGFKNNNAYDTFTLDEKPKDGIHITEVIFSDPVTEKEKDKDPDNNTKKNSSKEVIGNLIGKEKKDLTDSTVEVASYDDMEHALPDPGDGFDPGEELTLSVSDIEIEEVPEEKIVPKVSKEIPPEFTDTDSDPWTNLDELQKSIHYPELARKSRIEGKVNIKVWISPEAKPMYPQVIYSESSMLNEAALKALMSAEFTPAIKNSRPVGCWMVIPIKFILK